MVVCFLPCVLLVCGGKKQKYTISTAGFIF
jgi:hypothetical protein